MCHDAEVVLYSRMPKKRASNALGTRFVRHIHPQLVANKRARRTRILSLSLSRTSEAVLYSCAGTSRACGHWLLQRRRGPRHGLPFSASAQLHREPRSRTAACTDGCFGRSVPDRARLGAVGVSAQAFNYWIWTEVRARRLLLAWSCCLRPARHGNNCIFKF
jgi:hypothetical protein